MPFLKNAAVALAAASMTLASTAVAAERPAVAKTLKVTSVAQPVRAAQSVAKKDSLVGVPIVFIVIGGIAAVVAAVVAATDDGASPA